jgi:hypothetical protein
LLDKVSSIIWAGLVQKSMTVDQIQKLICGVVDVCEARAANDVHGFIESCIDKKLLIEGGSPSKPLLQRPLRAIYFPTLAAWLSLFSVSRKLRLRGFVDAYQDAVERAPQVAGPADNRRLSMAVSAFARAETFYSLPKAPYDCLPRSLALVLFLRSMGLPARHRIGFQRYPFNAHAWVECDGRVILDEDRRTSLTTFRAMPT